MLSWWQVLALLGALQGVTIAPALLARRTSRTPNRLLAALVLVLSLHLAAVVYYTADLVPQAPHLFGLTQPLPFLFGPLVYLYAVTLSDRARGLRRHDLLHLLPFVAVVLWGLPILLQDADAKVAMFRAIQGGWAPMQAVVTDPLKPLSGIAYTLATVLVVQRHQRVIAENYSTLDRVNLRWLQWLTLASGGVWLLAAVSEIAWQGGWLLPITGDLLIAIGTSLLICGVGYWGIRQPEIVRFATDEHPIAPTPAAPPAEPDPMEQRYERSGLQPREAEALTARLVAVMDAERPYRQADLTLGDLAERVGTTPHRLSEVLNSQLGVSFYDFVNGYRVREVQSRLVGPDGARLTYLAIALEAGFASKSTFNAAFKKLTGMTPSAYRASRLS